MKRSVSPESRPAYLRLYEKLRGDIVRGVYPYGGKLPSKRVAADEAGVSVITAEHAYAILCDEGYIEARERSGYFVIFRRDDGFASPAAATAAPTPAADRSVRPAFPFSVLTKAMRAVMSDAGPAIMERSPGEGLPQLREAIALYLARSRGIRTEADRIIVGAGAEYLYRLVVDLLGRDRLYAIEAPSYMMIERMYLACGAAYEMLPLGKDGIKSRDLWAAKADVLHISPYRSFPSGVTASASKRHEYLRWAEKPGRYIVEDDFESEFSVSRKPEETLISNTTRDNVIYINSFSQTISPSFRAGYMVLPRHLADQYGEKLGFYACTVPTFEQLVLERLLTGGDFERHINRVRRQKRRELAADK